MRFKAPTNAHIIYTGVRPGPRSFRTSFGVCAIDDGYAEPLDADSTTTQIRRVSVIIHKDNPSWKEIGIVPQIGDGINLDGVNYSVTAVSMFDSENYMLAARQR